MVLSVPYSTGSYIDLSLWLVFPESSLDILQTVQQRRSIVLYVHKPNIYMYIYINVYIIDGEGHTQQDITGNNAETYFEVIKI